MSGNRDITEIRELFRSLAALQAAQVIASALELSGDDGFKTGLRGRVADLRERFNQGAIDQAGLENELIACVDDVARHFGFDDTRTVAAPAPRKIDLV